MRTRRTLWAFWRRSGSDDGGRGLRGYALAGLGFAALSVVWTLPLVRHFSTHLPGTGYGDNVTFLWNFWWMRQALTTEVEFFRSAALFAPFGTDLTLHTHTALPAFVGAIVLGGLSPLEALNVTIIISVFLAGFCTYALSFRITGDKTGAAVAGAIFGTSPFLAGHLQGHFNLTHAWVLPLFALALHETVDRQSARWAVAAGLVLGATAYVDYYYLVFEGVLALMLIGFYARRWRAFRRSPDARSRLLANVIAVLILVDIALLAAIAITGGFAGTVLGVRISVRNWFNPLQALWLLSGVWLWLRLRPRVASVENPAVDVQRLRWVLLCTVAVFLVSAAPVIWNAVELMIRGDYVTQRHFWRSGPAGVDVSTLVLGNPFHGLWGESISRLLDARGIDVVESSAWIGVAAGILTIWALRRLWAQAAVRCWAVIGGAFFLWALGPHLTVFGVNTGMILPQALLRYLPILSNARIPGRAMVVVYLAVAILSAFALADLRRRSQWRSVLAGGALAAVLIDFMAAPVPLVSLSAPAIYETVRGHSGAGILLELPIGLRDGFGVRGQLDHRVLFYQTRHEMPVTGGFAARLSPNVVAAYDADPLFSALLRLSDSTADEQHVSLPDRETAAAILRSRGIRFVMLNLETAPFSLVRYVQGVLPLIEVARQGERVLYEVPN